MPAVCADKEPCDELNINLHFGIFRTIETKYK